MINNLIYAAVFNLTWVTQQLMRQRPYGEVFRHWLSSDGQDISCLLTGPALEEAQQWMRHNNHLLGDSDYRFLAASQEQDKKELQQNLEAEHQKAVKRHIQEQETRRLVQKRNHQLRRFLLGVIGSASVAIAALSLAIHSQNQDLMLAEQEVEVMAMAAETLTLSNRPIAALVTALQASHKIRQSQTHNHELNIRTHEALRQATIHAIATHPLEANLSPMSSTLNRIPGAAVLFPNVRQDPLPPSSFNTHPTLAPSDPDSTVEIIASLKDANYRIVFTYACSWLQQYQHESNAIDPHLSITSLADHYTALCHDDPQDWPQTSPKALPDHAALMTSQDLQSQTF
ncbi:MAG: hypothetical protein F6K09_11435 [Merismopedia sp. SIO2A8]|nr:hypothetical protein [Merismopedia sp. SIO2A8]